MDTVTVKEMKEIERIADSKGLSYYQMMENAGTGSYEVLMSEYPHVEAVIVFCGKGNNGGDGLVLARLAAENNKSVLVVLVEGEPVTKDALANYKKLPESVKVISVNCFNEKNIQNVSGNTVIIDALYGTGFHGELRENGTLACASMNSLNLPIISLDIPSGCSADERISCSDAVDADITVVFHAFKNAHVPPLKNCGKCVLVSIGING